MYKKKRDDWNKKKHINVPLSTYVAYLYTKNLLQLITLTKRQYAFICLYESWSLKFSELNVQSFQFKNHNQYYIFFNKSANILLICKCKYLWYILMFKSHVVLFLCWYLGKYSTLLIQQWEIKIFKLEMKCITHEYSCIYKKKGILYALIIHTATYKCICLPPMI